MQRISGPVSPSSQDPPFCKVPVNHKMGSQHISPCYSSHIFEVNVDGKRALFQCDWILNGEISSTKSPSASDCTQQSPCRTLDLLFTSVSIFPQCKRSASSTNAANGCIPNSGSWTMFGEGQSKVHLFVQEAIRRNANRFGSSITALKLLLPTIDGYAVRDDIIQRRFLTCDLIEEAADFTGLRQRIRAFKFDGENTLQKSLHRAVGAIILKGLPGLNRALVESAMAIVEGDVTARLSFPWISPIFLPRRRLAIVEGRPSPIFSAASLGVYRAARALGIQLVILDHDGHWVQDSAMEHLRDEFIVCDLTLDEDLPDRIAEALSQSKGPIDAITTYTDIHLLATARAARKMGLYTSPPEVLEVCRDKRKTRTVASADVRILSISGVADLKEKLPGVSSPLEYPLIVKPVTGSCSEGVSKVSSEIDLLVAVQRNEEKFPGVGTLVEPYISGPEVDANFVLLDGKLIWSEVNDDFPSSAEIPQETEVSRMSLLSPHSSSSSKSFAEMSTIMPSILPDTELFLVTSSLTETLLRLGFRNGVFHLEARVKDSSMNYSMTDKGIELMENRPGVGKSQDPSVFLIEINARLPGHQESFAVEYTYGIDYFALHMLMALSSGTSATQSTDNTALKSIIRALSQPLSATVQHPTNVVFIPAERGGTFVTAKPLPESLMSYVPQFTVFMQEGEVINDPDVEGKWPFVAYFLVVAKLKGAAGREQVRAIGEMVRDSFEYEMR